MKADQAANPNVAQVRSVNAHDILSRRGCSEKIETIGATGVRRARDWEIIGSVGRRAIPAGLVRLRILIESFWRNVCSVVPGNRVAVQVHLCEERRVIPQRLKNGIVQIGF